MSVTILNPVLVQQQKLGRKNMFALYGLHQLKDELFMCSKILLDPDNPKDLEALRHLAGALENIEFAMQAVWGFEQTNLKHSWWCQLPGCTCIPDYCDEGFPQHTSTECKIHS